MPRLFQRVALALFAAGSLTAHAGWTPVGLSGGGAMFGPAISPADPQRMMLHCDMSGAYRSADGGRNWTLIHADQLQGNITCRPAFHPRDAMVAVSPHGWSSRLRITRDGGSTWTELGDLGGSPQGEVVIVAANARPPVLRGGRDPAPFGGRRPDLVALPGGARRTGRVSRPTRWHLVRRYPRRRLAQR
jgi:hypothetical protein